jgi:hypothetical protein
MIQLGVEEFAVKVSENRHVTARWREQERDAGELIFDGLRLRTVEVLIELLRSNRLNRVDELKLLGEHLFVTLFGGPNENDYNTVGNLLKEAVSSGPGDDDDTRRLLRVALEIEVGNDRLAAWPWEYLYVPALPRDPDTAFFLGERINFVLTRSLPLSKRGKAINVRPPVRVLFVALSPRELASIQYESVLETLLQLRDREGYSRIDLRVLAEDYRSDGRKYVDREQPSSPRTTYGSFLSTVDQFEPHVIHIVGHGRYIHSGPQMDEGSAAGGQLAFRQSDHTALWISDSDLAGQLMDSPSLRLVFLQACESAETGEANPYQVISGLAQWLAQRNIPAVVAMNFQVENLLANEFARAFYETLAQRQPIEVAMHAARRQLYTSGVERETQRSGFGLPVLYLRGSGTLLSPLESSATAPVHGGRPLASSEVPQARVEVSRS